MNANPLAEFRDAAYDGSNAPQKRPLTALERDIICRIIMDIQVDGTARVFPRERQTLSAIFAALDPRSK